MHKNIREKRFSYGKMRKLCYTESMKRQNHALHLKDLFRQQAEQIPDLTAVKYQEPAGSGEITCVTYRQLYDDICKRAAEIAGSGLSAAGIPAGGESQTAEAKGEGALSQADVSPTEGIIVDGSYASVIEIFAANAAGLTVVMMEPLADPGLMKKRLAATDVNRLWTWGSVQEISSGPVRGKENRILFFTSGTTESARAVILTGDSLLASAYNGTADLPLTTDDTLLCMLPLFHVFGFVCGLLWGLVNGACVALGRGERHMMDDLAFFHPTGVSLVPVLFEFLLKKNLFNEELQTILIGAGGCPKESIEMAQHKGIRVCFGYGLTETSSGVAISVSGDPYAMQVCVEDKVTITGEGEILVESPACMMEGYYRNPEATEAVLKDGILHTGDIGFLDSGGKLHITGRIKDILVLPDGTKIFLPEYEAILARALPDLQVACGEENGEVILYYYGDMSEHEVERVLHGLMGLMPRGHQVRRIVRRQEPIPRNAAGKIVRSRLQI